MPSLGSSFKSGTATDFLLTERGYGREITGAGERRTLDEDALVADDKGTPVTVDCRVKLVLDLGDDLIRQTGDKGFDRNGEEESEITLNDERDTLDRLGVSISCREASFCQPFSQALDCRVDILFVVPPLLARLCLISASTSESSKDSVLFRSCDRKGKRIRRRSRAFSFSRPPGSLRELAFDSLAGRQYLSLVSDEELGCRISCLDLIAFRERGRGGVECW